MWFGIREATQEDIPEIYKYLHQSFIKRHSELNEETAYEFHLEWYKKALKSKEHKVYTIYNKEYKFIGQVRYEIKKETARVGIYLLEEVRGKGIARKALEKSICLLTDENKEIKKIISNILEENDVSIEVFKKCGFSYKEKKGEMLKYIKLV